MSNISSSAFSIKEMIVMGWPILSVLLACSIVSLAVIWDRWKTFRAARHNLPKTLEQIALKISQGIGLEEKEKIAQYEILRWTAPLEERLSILGTIASTAPFIGLLGTVIGIIRAFRAVSVSMGGGHASVANGIAEALVATAIGLMVAIPAVMAYNFFNSKLQRLEQQMRIATADVLTGRRK